MLAFAHGSRQRAGAGLPEVKSTEPLEPLVPPADLEEGARQVWDELAPLATQLRTLAPATRVAFVDLCHARADRDACRARMAADGWVVTGGMGERKKHPLEVALRGWEHLVDVGMKAFGLSPFGKPVIEEAKPEDPFAEFEAKA